jgi:site-specific recombinase XerD
MESRKARNVGANTLKWYNDVLTRYLNAVGNPYIARCEDIQKYTNTISLGKGEHAYVRYNTTGVIKTFHKWLADIYNVGNPAEKVEFPKLGKPIHPTLTIEEIRDVLSKQSTRDKAIIALATESGLRRFELANVRVEHIDWQTGKVRVLGKGRKEIYAPVGDLSKKYIKDYLKETGRTSGSLFGLNKWGIASAFKRLEGEKHVSPHMLRRSFATILRDMGLDVLTIMQLGRWESPSMVQRYTRAFDFDSALKHYKSPLTSLLTS